MSFHTLFDSLHCLLCDCLELHCTLHFATCASCAGCISGGLKVQLNPTGFIVLAVIVLVETATAAADNCDLADSSCMELGQQSERVLS